MNLPQKPQLLPWARVVSLPERLLCYCGDRMVTFQGKACETFLPAILRALNGSNSSEQVYKAFPEEAKPAIDQVFRQLLSRNLLMEGLAAGKTATAVSLFFGSNYGVPISQFELTMEKASISVCGTSPVAGSVLCHLQEAGVRNLNYSEAFPDGEGELASLTICCPNSNQLKDVEGWNQLALARKADWLFSSANFGRTAFAGPLFVYPDTGCFECFLRRRQSHSFLANDFGTLDGGALNSAIPALASDMVSSMTAAIAIRWLASKDPSLPGHCQVLEWGSSPKISNHTLHRVPRCTRCSRTQIQSTASPWGVGLVSNTL